MLLGLQLGYMVLLLGTGLFLSFMTRRIHTKVAWGELRWLSFAVRLNHRHDVAVRTCMFMSTQTRISHVFISLFLQIYNVTFWVIIIGLMMGLLRDFVVASMVVVCLCMLLLCVITALFVFGVKLYFIVFKRALLDAGGDAEFSTNFSPDSIANAKDE